MCISGGKNMIYKVKHLRENLPTIMMNMGLSQDFKENPAFSSALVEIDSILSNIGSSSLDETEVYQKDKDLSFSFKDADDNYYAFGINMIDPRFFRCVAIKQLASDYVENKEVKKRVVIEKNVMLEDNNYISIATNGSSINNAYCSPETCRSNEWRVTERYSSSGIMVNKETKEFKDSLLKKRFDDVSVDDMLYISHHSSLPNVRYSTKYLANRILLSREYLDTAHIYMEDKINKKTFYSVVPLNQDEGLRNMNINEEYTMYPKDIVIPALEDWEIDLMITSESNQKVQEGLKSLAIGRSGYAYNSAKDSQFERTLQDESIEKTISA